MKDKIICGIMVLFLILYHLAVIYIGAHPDDFREGINIKGLNTIILRK